MGSGRSTPHIRAARFAAVLSVLAGVGLSAPAAHADAAPYQLPWLVDLSGATGYQAELADEVGFWNVDTLAIAGLNDDHAGQADGQGIDAVAPAGGWDGLSAPWPGGGGLVARTTGKLFMRMVDPVTGGFDYLSTCSASVVDSGNLSVVVTAAHCLRENWGTVATPWGEVTVSNEIASDVVFVPGFNGTDLARYVMGSDWQHAPAPGTDIAPYGVWGVTGAWVTGAWSQQANNLGGDDMAALTVANPADPRPIQQVVGGQQISFTEPRDQYLHAFSYPTDNKASWYSPDIVGGVPTFTGQPNGNGAPADLQRVYDGRTLMESQGRATSDSGQENDVLSAAMSPGSSGGPWFEGFDPTTGQGTVVAVTSHFVPSADGGIDTTGSGCESGGSVWIVQLPGACPYLAGTHFGAQEQAVYDAAQSAAQGG